jgi:hypothetical protein
MRSADAYKINWYPEILERGPLVKFCFDSQTGEGRPFQSSECDKRNIHDSSYTRDNAVEEIPESK